MGRAAEMENVIQSATEVPASFDFLFVFSFHTLPDPHFIATVPPYIQMNRSMTAAQSTGTYRSITLHRQTTLFSVRSRLRGGGCRSGSAVRFRRPAAVRVERPATVREQWPAGCPDRQSEERPGANGKLRVHLRAEQRPKGKAFRLPNTLVRADPSQARHQYA